MAEQKGERDPTGSTHDHLATKLRLPPNRQWWSLLFMPALLGIQAGLLAYGSYVHSPTLNEPAHLMAGISYWKSGRFDVYSVNPPLVRLIAAAPAILVGAKTDWHSYSDAPGIRPEFMMGDDFIVANGEQIFWLVTIARWACIPFSLIGGYICYRWASDLYGRAAGLLSLALWCFCPNILAHGQLITCDAAATALGLAACYAFWRWLKLPSWYRTIICGVALGLAELTKLTFIIFYPLLLVLWVVYRWSDRHSLRGRDWLREASMLVIQIVLSVWIINVNYAFEGTGTPLGTLPFESATLSSPRTDGAATANDGNRFTRTWLGGLPTPLPKDYLIGIDRQRRDFEDYSQPSYLHGTFSPQGWWYYYLYALAIKVPLGTWQLLGFAAAVRMWSKPGGRWRDEFLLLCPPILLLTFVSSQTGFTEHMRYVLPIFPFFFIWIGRLIAALGSRHRFVTGLAIVALAWSIGSSLWVYPHSLSYFNELAGGPRGGSAHLIHSNVDWGQDLLKLKAWLSAHPEARPLKLAYFGPVDPRYAGIEYEWPEASAWDAAVDWGLQPGWYAVSVNFVRGYPRMVFTGDGGFRKLRYKELRAFETLEPFATAGYSIRIYHVPDRR